MSLPDKTHCVSLLHSSLVAIGGAKASNYNYIFLFLASSPTFPQMDSLDLNMLTSAESLVSYHRISKLTMTGNLLSQLDTHSLPNALRHLNLRNNLLTEINTAGLPVDLQHLGLAGNQVQQLTNENLGHFAREGLTVCAIHWILSLSSSDLFAHELKN